MQRLLLPMSLTIALSIATDSIHAWQELAYITRCVRHGNPKLVLGLSTAGKGMPPPSVGDPHKVPVVRCMASTA